MWIKQPVAEIWPFEISQEVRSVVDRSSVGQSSIIVLMSYTPLRYVRKRSVLFVRWVKIKYRLSLTANCISLYGKRIIMLWPHAHYCTVQCKRRISGSDIRRFGDSNYSSCHVICRVADKFVGACKRAAGESLCELWASGRAYGRSMLSQCA